MQNRALKTSHFISKVFHDKLGGCQWFLSNLSRHLKEDPITTTYEVKIWLYLLIMKYLTYAVTYYLLFSLSERNRLDDRSVTLDHKFLKATYVNSHIWAVPLTAKSKWVNKLEVSAYGLLSFLVTMNTRGSKLIGSETHGNPKRYNVKSSTVLVFQEA